MLFIAGLKKLVFSLVWKCISVCKFVQNDLRMKAFWSISHEMVGLAHEMSLIGMKHQKPVKTREECQDMKKGDQASLITLGGWFHVI